MTRRRPWLQRPKHASGAGARGGATVAATRLAAAQAAVSIVLVGLGVASRLQAQEVTADEPRGRASVAAVSTSTDSLPAMETAPVPDAADPAAPATDEDTAGEPDPSPTEEDELAEPEPGPVLTLAEALDLAVARHPDIRAVRAELDRADALLHQAWGALLPRVSAQLAYTLNDQETTADFGALAALIPGMDPPPPMVLVPQNVVQTSVTIEAPLFNMPIYSAIETARLGRSIAILSEQEAQRQIRIGVAVAYYGALAAAELIDIQATAYRTARERHRAARTKLDLGAGAAVDASIAELEMEAARLAHEAAVLGYERAREALAGLLVMDELPVPVSPDAEYAVPGSDGQLVEQALADRPDVQLRRAALDVAEEGLWSAWAAFFPSVSVTWQDTTELTEPSGFGGRRNVWFLMLALDIPIYDESRYGLLDQRRAEIVQAEANVESVEQTVKAEVRTAWRDYEASLTAVETAERQVDVAAETLHLTEASFALGEASSLEVDLAQQRHTAAQVGLAMQRYQARMALARLLLLVGEIPEA